MRRRHDYVRLGTDSREAERLIRARAESDFNRTVFSLDLNCVVASSVDLRVHNSKKNKKHSISRRKLDTLTNPWLKQKILREISRLSSKIESRKKNLSDVNFAHC